MRIVFIGAVEFSYYCLEEVIKNGGNVVGIVTFKSSAVNSDFCDLSPLAEKYGIPIFYCRNINEPDSVFWIRNKRPDIIFCWGISQLIKSELLAIPRMGILGEHPALLPQNRGRHPLIWALALGLEESGLTFFFIDEGADSGPILSQKRFAIDQDDTAGTLYNKIKTLAREQIAEFLPQLISGRFSVFEQNGQTANNWRKRSHADGVIDWRMGKTAILNLVRALTHPYVGAEFGHNGQSITVWRACEYRGPVLRNIECGKIIKVIDGRPVIKCYDGAVQIEEYQPADDFTEGEYL